MKKLIVNGTGEIVGEGNVIPEGHIQVNAPDGFEYIPTLLQMTPDKQIVKLVGTILSPEEIESLSLQVLDREARLQKIQDEINALVGLSILSMTDLQRMKLLAIVLYKLGVINSNGIVQPFNKWLDID